MRLGRARFLASIGAVAALVGGLAAAADQAASAVSTALPTALVALAGNAPAPLPSGAVRLGTVPPQSSLSVDVGLRLGNEAGLDALLNGQADRKSPYFSDFLGKGQFGPMFGLSLPQIAQVSSGLRALGLNPGQVDPSRLDIPVTATAAALDRAFGVKLLSYRLANGRIAYRNSAAPQVPAAIAPFVSGVIGLDDVYQMQRMAQPILAKRPAAVGPAVVGAAAGAAAVGNTAAPAAAGPSPCLSAVGVTTRFFAYTANQYASHYALNGLYSMGDFGQGVRVAVAELEPNLKSDISGFEACYKINTRVNYVTVTPGVGTGAGQGEAALDIENIASLAPKATVDVFQSPNTGGSLYEIAKAVLDAHIDSVLSISWGLCEAETTPSLLAQYQAEFKALAASGITVVASSGDTGPTGCYTPSDKSMALSPIAPASTNYVDSVGGTSMSAAGQLAKETAWGGAGAGNAGGGGGGVSGQCMPQYQLLNNLSGGVAPLDGLPSNLSKTAAKCKVRGNPKGFKREVPDIAAAASPVDGYVTFFRSAWGGEVGTSASTTLVAAEAALIDASPYCSRAGWGSGHVGLLADGLYTIMYVNGHNIYHPQTPWVVHDITQGASADKAIGYAGGLYPATVGYDMATGLGAPLLTGIQYPTTANPGMASSMCHVYAPDNLVNVSTTSVFPKYGKVGRNAAVTIHGTGMLAVPHTVLAIISNKNNSRSYGWVWAYCSSHTTCKATIPALAAGTYSIELSPVGFFPCTTCSPSAPFTFVKAPHLKSISPAHGGRGTRVTITGANFDGVSAVYFGSKKGGSVRVLSAAKLTVVVPSGSGRVAVKVAAAGGMSNALSYTY
jgi:subtilase family serine protease